MPRGSKCSGPGADKVDGQLKLQVGLGNVSSLAASKAPSASKGEPTPQGQKLGAGK